jgi:hypothetical protein
MIEKISNLSIGSGKEVIATVIKQGNQEDWFCNCMECGNKFKGTGDKKLIKCPKCGAVQSDEKDEGVLATPLETLTIEDDTASILLDLYGDNARKLRVGTQVKILNGWVKEFKDKETGVNVKAITPGRYGTIITA